MAEPRRAPAHAVDRPVLRAQLDVGVRAPLTVVVAPAGAGKTVLLAQWIQSRPDLTTAWFDIGAEDRAVTAFARHLVEGISAVAPGARVPASPVIASDGRLGRPFLAELAGRLDRDQQIVLVFDDLDRLTGTGLLDDLRLLVDLLPPNAHIVFSSRVDLHLQSSRFRLEHGLVELRQRELAFDDETTAQVLESIMGHTVTDETAAAVTSRTEGWAAGVQLTALSLRFTSDPARVVEELSETNGLIIDYLSEEVLDALSPSRRDTLMRVALLDEMCAGLVEALADVDGAAFLAKLESDSLFTTPVPARPGWYRLHRLFRDLLIYRLRAADRRAEATVLEAAADWHFREDDPDTAIEYLTRARNWDRVLDAVLAIGSDLYEEVRTAKVARWLSLMPADVRHRRWDAEVLLAIAEGMSGKVNHAADRFQALIANDAISIGQRQVALAYLAAEVQFHSPPEVFLDLAEQALALLTAHPDAVLPNLIGLTSRPLLIAVAEVSRARAKLFLGRLPEAYDELTSALRSGRLGYAPYRIHAIGTLALVNALSGRLTAAREESDAAIEAAAEFGLRGHPAPGDAFLARAIVAIQRGDVDSAAAPLADGSVSAASNRRTQLMWIAYLVAQLVPGPSEYGRERPAGPPPPVARHALTALALRRSRLRGMPRIVQTAGAAWTPVVFEEIAALLELRETAAAAARLAQFEGRSAGDVPITALELDLLHGWLDAVRGQRAQARERISAALRRAESEWLAHPFIRIGPPIAGLVEEVSAGRSEFARFVERRSRLEAAPGEERLTGDLTQRELELLVYLPTRFTISEIAERCFVSTNTIKTHLAHIYRKLGVDGRDAAIERAIVLRLLDPPEHPALSRETTAAP